MYPLFLLPKQIPPSIDYFLPPRREWQRQLCAGRAFCAYSASRTHRISDQTTSARQASLHLPAAFSTWRPAPALPFAMLPGTLSPFSLPGSGSHVWNQWGRYICFDKFSQALCLLPCNCLPGRLACPFTISVTLLNSPSGRGWRTRVTVPVCL